MRASERREAIAQATASGMSRVEELAARFGVTASTIRRDLAHLTADGSLARTYGGVIALQRESPLDQRSAENLDGKRAIGRWAAAQVSPGSTVLLDAGSTIAELARNLRPPLTVFTAGLTSLGALEGSGIEVFCLGGRYREISRGFVGPLVEAALDTMTFDAAFLGGDAVTARRGICEATLEQTRLKVLMARAARRVYVLMDASKLGDEPFNAWTPLERDWTLVTDHTATPEQLEPFRMAGFPVVVSPSV